mmetsp:Transcript_20787/g.53651  ORF Transcript_20787/g.53651 Transcript_20787/m.53651 type:complete len:219 (-) Transcript_20787:89-745(-)
MPLVERYALHSVKGVAFVGAHQARENVPQRREAHVLPFVAAHVGVVELQRPQSIDDDAVYHHVHVVQSVRERLVQREEVSQLGARDASVCAHISELAQDKDLRAALAELEHDLKGVVRGHEPTRGTAHHIFVEELRNVVVEEQDPRPERLDAGGPEERTLLCPHPRHEGRLHGLRAERRKCIGARRRRRLACSLLALPSDKDVVAVHAPAELVVELRR